MCGPAWREHFSSPIFSGHCVSALTVLPHLRMSNLVFASKFATCINKDDGYHPSSFFLNSISFLKSKHWFLRSSARPARQMCHLSGFCFIARLLLSIYPFTGRVVISRSSSKFTPVGVLAFFHADSPIAPAQHGSHILLCGACFIMSRRACTPFETWRNGHHRKWNQLTVKKNEMLVPYQNGRILTFPCVDWLI